MAKDFLDELTEISTAEDPNYPCLVAQEQAKRAEARKTKRTLERVGACDSCGSLQATAEAQHQSAEVV